MASRNVSVRALRDDETRWHAVSQELVGGRFIRPLSPKFELIWQTCRERELAVFIDLHRQRIGGSRSRWDLVADGKQAGERRLGGVDIKVRRIREQFVFFGLMAVERRLAVRAGLDVTSECLPAGLRRLALCERG